MVYINIYLLSLCSVYIYKYCAVIYVLFISIYLSIPFIFIRLFITTVCSYILYIVIRQRAFFVFSVREGLPTRQPDPWLDPRERAFSAPIRFHLLKLYNVFVFSIVFKKTE